MLIKANTSEFNIEYKFIKRLVLTMNSSQVYVANTIDGPFLPIDTSFVTGRRFKQIHKSVDFIVPVPVCILLHKDQVVSIESLPRDHDASKKPCNVQATGNRVLDEIDASVAAGHQWYFDGTYCYCFISDSVDEAIRTGTNLSGNFRGVQVISYDMTKVSYMYQQDTRFCIAFTTAQGSGISAPIWSYIGNENFYRNKKATDRGESDLAGENERGSLANLEDMDRTHSITLMYTLSAARAIAKQFGYKSIVPMRLPQLMLLYNTVNLMALPQAVLKTTPVDVPVSHMFAWLLGLQRRATTMEQMLTIRRLLKYLSVRGVISKNIIKQDSVFNNKDHTYNDVPTYVKPELPELL